MVWNSPPEENGNVTLQMYSPNSEFAFENNAYVGENGGVVADAPAVSDEQVKMDETGSLGYPDEDSDDGEEITLMYARHERIPMKDFNAEIRASMDVERFVSQAVLLLDLHETNLEKIFNSMLHKMCDTDEPQCNIEEAKSAMFTHDSVHMFSKTIQGTSLSDGGGIDYDQSWICALCKLPSLQRRHVAIARLKHPANFGRTSQEIRFVLLVLAPTKEKGTKNALETGRTFSTLFADIDLRQRLLVVSTEDEFKKILWENTKSLAEKQSKAAQDKKKAEQGADEMDSNEKKMQCRYFCGGLLADLRKRLPHYWSDYKDGVVGPRSVQKTVSATFFLYFACVLPSIAFGMLNDKNTQGSIDVKKVFYSQTIGGLFFALFGGQPLVVLLTTAPLALYTKIIFSICKDFDLDFLAMFTCTGLWNCCFLILYSVFGASHLMKFSTRSTEEIFALFISLAFSADAVRDVIGSFDKYYNAESCKIKKEIDNILSSNTSLKDLTTEAMTTAATVTGNLTTVATETVTDNIAPCLKENSLLFIILMLGTLWLGITLFNFTKTPFLNTGKREILADYALPVAVLFMSFIGSYVFRDVKLKPFNYSDQDLFRIPQIHTLPWPAVLGALGLAFPLSLLFFMDQNITAALVNTPANKLKKGEAYHWDLLIVAVINIFLSMFGLPWVHGALPHSPLHARALADMEDRVDQGHVYQLVIRVRETRLAALISHILIGLSLFLLPYPLSYIPRPVLDGLFLYVAVTALYGNQMFERVLLLFTEQAAYPPNHYIRRVPQRKIHIFTFVQLLQLLILCGIGFSPIAYMKMGFPVLIMLLLPIRHKLIPKIVDKKYLQALDGDAGH